MHFHQKSYRYVAIAAAAVSAPILIAPTAAGAEALSFSDLSKEESGYDEVMALAKKQIVNGYEDGTFKPYDNISRVHVAVLLTRALNLEVPADVSKVLSIYEDVDVDAAYAEEIAAVTQANIFKGHHGKFEAKKPITREQMATVLVHAFQLRGKDEPAELADLDKIDASHRENVSVLAQNGIAVGKEMNDGKRYFDGQRLLKRVQFAIFLNRALEGPKSITGISANRVTISGQTYQIADHLQGLFAEKNSTALQDAGIVFEASQGVITKVTKLEIRNNGSKQEPLLIDAAGTKVVGDVSIKGRHATLHNLSISGDLTVEGQDFNGSGLKVDGLTAIKEGRRARAASTETQGGSVTFTESSLGVMEIDSVGTALELKSGSTAEKINIKRNTKLTADTRIPKLVFSGQAREVEVNGKVADAQMIPENVQVTLSGTVEVERLVIAKAKAVLLDIAGTIGKLELKSDSTLLTLGKVTKIKNLLLPENRGVEQVITNYNAVKSQVSQIGGRPHSDDATPPATDGSGGSISRPQPEEGGGQPPEDEMDGADSEVETDDAAPPAEEENKEEPSTSLPDDKDGQTDPDDEDIGNEPEPEYEKAVYDASGEITAISHQGIVYKEGSFVIPAGLEHFTFKDGGREVAAKKNGDKWTFEMEAIPLQPAAPVITALSSVELNGEVSIFNHDEVYTATVASSLHEDGQQYELRITFDSVTEEGVEDIFDPSVLGTEFLMQAGEKRYQVIKEGDGWIVAEPAEDDAQPDMILEAPLQQANVKPALYEGKINGYSVMLDFNKSDMPDIVSPDLRFTVLLLDEKGEAIAESRVVKELPAARPDSPYHGVLAFFDVNGAEQKHDYWHLGRHGGHEALLQTKQLKVSYELDGKIYEKCIDLAIPGNGQVES